MSWSSGTQSGQGKSGRLSGMIQAMLPSMFPQKFTSSEEAGASVIRKKRKQPEGQGTTLQTKLGGD